jgi:hypothetical protein
MLARKEIDNMLREIEKNSGFDRRIRDKQQQKSLNLFIIAFLSF